METTGTTRRHPVKEGGLFGGAGSDTLHGGDGNDYIVGSGSEGTASDVMWGGKGDDLLIYGDAGGWNRPWIDVGTTSTRMVMATADSNDGHPTRAMSGDPYLFGAGALDLNDEQALKEANVTLVGLFGGQGDDTLIGGSGPDLLDGGSGNDTVSYEDSNGAVTVDLAAATTHGTATGGDGDAPEAGFQTGASDLLVGIENVIGSDEDDSITGDDRANMLNGGEGDDTLTGGGGADTFVFKDGEGNDTIDDFSRFDRDKIDLRDFEMTTAQLGTAIPAPRQGRRYRNRSWRWPNPDAGWRATRRPQHRRLPTIGISELHVPGSGRLPRGPPGPS